MLQNSGYSCMSLSLYFMCYFHIYVSFVAGNLNYYMIYLIWLEHEELIAIREPIILYYFQWMNAHLKTQ